MKRILVILLVLILFPVLAWASPFLVCDPQVGVHSYILSGDVNAIVSAEADGSLRYDLGALAVGTYNLSVIAHSDGFAIDDNTWMEGDSDPVPFVYTRKRPSAPALRLTGQ